MARLSIGPRLIIVCGLPGSGKTTLAKAIESTVDAIRFCPDEWMDALGIDLYDEESRARIEGLQWQLAQDLLSLGLTVIIEWGTWARSERDTLRFRRASLALPSNYAISLRLWMFSSSGFNTGPENPSIEQDELTPMGRNIPGADAGGDGAFRQAFGRRPDPG